MSNLFPTLFWNSTCNSKNHFTVWSYAVQIGVTKALECLAKIFGQVAYVPLFGIIYCFMI